MRRSLPLTFTFQTNILDIKQKHDNKNQKHVQKHDNKNPEVLFFSDNIN